MKKISLIVFSLGLAVILTACGTTAEKESKTKKSEIKEEVPAENKEVHSSDGNQILLDNGNRWKVNPEMIPHLQASEQALKSYQKNNGSDYKQLAAEMKEHNDQLISSCTMKGESHEQLHHWLHPHLKLVKALSEAENEETAEGIIRKLEASFEEYHNYFN